MLESRRRATQHFRGRPISKDFRSIFEPILKDFSEIMSVELLRNQVSFHLKVQHEGKVAINHVSELKR